MKTYNSYQDFTISTNLIAQAVHHVDFLREIDETGTFYSPSVLPMALYRYEKYWLPLAKDYRDECLSAPIDIEWVWHCHMLRPRKYIEDCETIVGHVVNHTLKSRKEYRSANKRSKELWEMKYKNVPFNLDMNNIADEPDMDGFQSRLTYDVIAAAGRQKEFFYNVSLPHYKDPKFLQRGLDRYQKMLFMKQKYPKQYLIPCYDNDLIWHTHQLNPCIYQRDMIRFFGEIFDHDDSTNDRSAGSKLTNCYAETIELWKNTFNEYLQQPGAMYRTKPPGGILYKMTENDVFILAPKKISVSMDLSVELSKIGSGKIFIQTIGYGDCSEKPIKLCKTEEMTPCNETHFKTLHFDIDTLHTNSIQFETMTRNGTTSCLDSPEFNLMKHIEDNSGHIRDVNGSFNTTVPFKTNNKLHVNGSYNVSRQDNVVLFLDKGDYEEGTIPENLREEWGPLNIDRLGPGIDSKCRIATHGLKTFGSKEALMKARVIHCPSLRQSYVQVFWQEKIAAVSHFIYPENIPAQSMVRNKSTTTLDPKDGERAMLIKNHAGDWAIVVGKFLKPRKIISQNGSLQARVIKLPSGKITKCKVGYTDKTFNFQLDELKADFTDEVLEVKQGSNEVAENVALAISIAILRDQCLPCKR